ncbi:MAG: BON domain-containing protein, partial [Pseudomonadota bacterium]
MQSNPPTTTQISTPVAAPRSSADLKSMRSHEFRPRRALWPGLLGAAVIGAAIGAVVISNYYDERSLGARVDATVVAAESKVQSGVEDLRSAASGAAQGTAEVADRVAGKVGDTAITAAVKTALAADPSLSALHIDVTTNQGSVRLEGPAPDTKSRQRAEVLAAA